MTIFSGDFDHGQEGCHPPAVANRPVKAEGPLPEILHELRQQIDRIRASGGPESTHSTGPADLALTVVAEALAIGEAMSRISADSASDDPLGRQSPAIFGEIDSRFVEHRTRALRSALHGVDDYVWWGGLVAATG